VAALNSSPKPSVNRRPKQLSLGLPAPRTWGGQRRGAGRKRGAERPPVPHRARPEHAHAHPVHVTLRARFRPLRSQFVEPTIRRAIGGADRRDRDHFRIIGYSIQYDHLHLLVEASNKEALASGTKSVAVRIARGVNALVRRRGRFWADRWHGRELTSPRQVRMALVYVVANFRKHSRGAVRPGIDPYSSGRWFDGWQLGPGPQGKGADVMPESAPVSRPRTWLARVGWRRGGPIRLDEAPVGAPRT
jgi:putative transposase